MALSNCLGTGLKIAFSALALVALPALAQEPAAPSEPFTLHVPGLSDGHRPALPACENHPGQQSNCTRILACIGRDGLWFDGQAHGWDTGIVIGAMSDGTTCEGHWESGLAFGSGRSVVSCSDGSRARVIYYTQDSETGTVEGSGLDSHGRYIKVWTGQSVLQFLTEDAERGPQMECGGETILIS